MNANQSNQTSCPTTELLADYLQGRLESSTHEQFESHVADCPACHETLRGLDGSDTLSEYVAGALDQSSLTEQQPTDADQSHIDGLVERLMGPTSSSDRGRHSIGPRLSSAEAEQLADRAAEVLRCVTPDDDEQSLGLLGDYRLIRLIGAGTTGVVFQAIDQTLDRSVALKVLRPSLGSIARERFIAEARLAASIEHQNVVTIYQIGEQDRLAFIAMQWLPGQTLAAKLLDSTGLPEEEIRDIACQITAGLHSAHQRQLVHRDIKPANIWLCDGSGDVKILDFGLARIVDEDPGLTGTGMLAGTPNFMSPEQTKGQDLDGRSDLFSLGCVLYQMATDKFPFGSATILSTLQAIQHEQPQPPKSINPRLSSDVSDLTMALLEKQAVNRPASATQVETMLTSPREQWPIRVGTYEAIETQPTPGTAPATRPSSSRNRWAAGVVACLLGLAAFVFSPQIIRIATNSGELVIEPNEANVEVQVLQNGEVIRVLDTKTKGSFDIREGEYQLKIAGDENSFDVTPASVTMKRGEKQIVKVTKGEQANGISDTVRQAVDSAQPFDPSLSPEVAKLVEEWTIGEGVATPRQLRQSISHSKKEIAGLIKVLGSNHPSVTEPRNRLAASEYILEKLEGNTTDATATSEVSGHSEFGHLLKNVRQQFVDKLNKQKAILGNSHPEIREIQRDIEYVEEQFAKLDDPKPSQAKPRSSAPTFKGQPFDHWINIAQTDRSSEIVCEALKASNQLADTSQQRERVMELARPLVRKHGSSSTTGHSDSACYAKTLKNILLSSPANERIDFIIEEISKGSSQSVTFCKSIINRSKRSSDLLEAIAANFQRSASHRALVSTLRDRLIPEFRYRYSFQMDLPEIAPRMIQSVHSLEKLDPNFAAAVRRCFLDKGATRRFRFAIANLAILFNPYNLKIRSQLESDLLTKDADPEIQERLHSLLFSFHENYFVAPLPTNVQQRTVAALQRLLENQTGEDAQRATFPDLESISFQIKSSDQTKNRRFRPWLPRYSFDITERGENDRGIGWWRYAIFDRLQFRKSAAGAGRSVGPESPWDKDNYSYDFPLTEINTIKGPAAVIWHSLMHAYDLQRATKYPSNDVARRLVEPKLMRPFLESVIDIEDNDDKALVEDLRTLCVFKNARWMLEQASDPAQATSTAKKMER